jgi:hypothetical protein
MLLLLFKKSNRMFHDLQTHIMMTAVIHQMLLYRLSSQRNHLELGFHHIIIPLSNIYENCQDIFICQKLYRNKFFNLSSINLSLLDAPDEETAPGKFTAMGVNNLTTGDVGFQMICIISMSIIRRCWPTLWYFHLMEFNQQPYFANI